MKLFETIIGEEQSHFNYFDNVGEHIRKLGASYLARIAGPRRHGPAIEGLRHRRRERLRTCFHRPLPPLSPGPAAASPPTAAGTGICRS